MRINNFLFFTLVLFMFLTAGTVFSQSLEINGGLELGWGSASYTYGSSGVYIEDTIEVIIIGLGLQIGAMWEKIALLAEGDIQPTFPGINWNTGAICEFYPFIFKNGETKLGFGLGAGYGSLNMNNFYAKIEFPFIFSSGKICIYFKNFFVDRDYAYSIGLNYYMQISKLFRN